MRKKAERKKKFNTMLFIAVIAALIVGVLIGILISLKIEIKERKYIAIEEITNISIAEIDNVTLPQLDLEDFTQVDVAVEPGVIHLSSDCLQLDMTTSAAQTDSIQSGIEKIIGARPRGHDIIASTLENFNIKVLFVKIDSLEDTTYYAKLLLQQSNKILILDSRPSDAIAIAVRTASNIYVKKDLLEEYGIKIC